MAFLVLLSVTGSVLASSSTYNESANIYVDVTTDEQVATTLYGLGLASKSFDTQEQAHTYAAERGLGVQHSYVVLRVNGKAVLFIDPPCYYPTGSGDTRE